MSERGNFRDASITSLSGSSETLLAQNGNRQFLLIENTGDADIGVNLTGGTAAIGGTGTLTIVANGSLILDHFVCQNEVTVIGTSGQPVCCYEC